MLMLLFAAFREEAAIRESPIPPWHSMASFKHADFSSRTDGTQKTTPGTWRTY